MISSACRIRYTEGPETWSGTTQSMIRLAGDRVFYTVNQAGTSSTGKSRSRSGSGSESAAVLKPYASGVAAEMVQSANGGCWGVGLPLRIDVTFMTEDGPRKELHGAALHGNSREEAIRLAEQLIAMARAVR
jgi:hypothetical protein